MILQIMERLTTILLVLVSIVLLSGKWKQAAVQAGTPIPGWARKYTKTSTGCPCWFDLSRAEECACCHNKGIQCGYPQHQYCQRDAKRGQYRKGCRGFI